MSTPRTASTTDAKKRLEEKRAAETAVAWLSEPILLGSMRRHPEATVEVHWGNVKAGTSACGFLAEFEEVIAAAKAEALREVERDLLALSWSDVARLTIVNVIRCAIEARP